MSQQVAQKLFTEQQLTDAVKTYYTVPVNTRCVLKSLWLTNTSNVARLVTIYLGSGGAGDNNTVVKTMGVPPSTPGGAGGGAPVPGAANLVLNEGDTIQAFCDAGGAVTMFGAGVEISG